jgi:NAD+ kinase
MLQAVLILQKLNYDFMKVAIVAKEDRKMVERLLKKHKLKIVSNKPDIVVCNGGDGTILLAERLYPSIPKLAAKSSKICRKCDYSPAQLEAVLELLKQRKYTILQENKIKANFKGKELVALNEIQIRNKNPTVALRFSVSVDGRKYNKLIGDGVIVATAFGSTGYYKSAGGRRFKRGIGIVFNNLYFSGRKSFVVSERSKIKVKVEREKGLLIRDNDNKFIKLKPGNEVRISLAKGKARFIEL